MIEFSRTTLQKNQRNYTIYPIIEVLKKNKNNFQCQNFAEKKVNFLIAQSFIHLVNVKQ